MPIYEFSCPKCRKIFSFLSKRINPDHLPTCPKCGNKHLEKQMSTFAMPRGSTEESPSADTNDPMAGMDNPKVMQAMAEIERDMGQLDENNPKHMAHVMRKMKEVMPPGTMPKELDVAIKRLEAGEDPEAIEADMGDVFADPEGGHAEGGAGGYTRDAGLYDY